MRNSDSPLPIPANLSRKTNRIALLTAFFEAYTEGRIGTPQERLAALHTKAISDRLLERMSSLPLADVSRIYFRLVKGEHPEDILADVDTP